MTERGYFVLFVLILQCLLWLYRTFKPLNHHFTHPTGDMVEACLATEKYNKNTENILINGVVSMI